MSPKTHGTFWPPVGTAKGEQADEWLEIRRKLAAAAQALSPGIGCCGHCHMPWTVVTSHSTRFWTGRGMFPLCEPCWTMLLPEERWPYYLALLNEWGEHDKAKCIKDVHEAVMEGG